MTLIERPIVDLLVLETSEDGETWQAWTPALNDALEVVRGGSRDGASSVVEPGTISAHLLDVVDPLTDPTLHPNLVVRLRTRTNLGAIPLFTGRLIDVVGAYILDEHLGRFVPVVTIAGADSVESLSAITRYGAVVEGGAGYESWALRIARLASSARTAFELPEDDAPIVRYAI